VTFSSLASLRCRLLLLVLAAAAPALFVILFTAAEQRKLDTLRAENEVRLLAHTAAMEQERLIEGARQLLGLMAKLPAVRVGDRDVCSYTLGELLKQYPIYANFGAIRPDGEVFCSALDFQSPVDLSHRAYFRRAIETKHFAVGDYQIGQITGKRSINFAYPVLDEKGEIEAVVFSALDLAWLNRFAARVRLPDGAEFFMIDRQGTVLAHYPDPEQWVGKFLPDAALLKSILSQQGEGVVRNKGFDGITRLYGFSAPRNGSQPIMHVSVGMPLGMIFHHADHMLKRNLAVFIAVTALVFLAAWIGSDLFILEKLRTMLATVKRFATGNLAARTGFHYGANELDQLGYAFDEMASSLQKSLDAHIQAEAEIRRLNVDLEKHVRERTRDLEAANNELEAFSYSVSHDLRVPLRAIDGFTRILLEEYSGPLPLESKRLLSIIRASIQQMSQLIDDLLSFSRLTRREFRKTEIDMAELADSVVQELRRSEPERPLEVSIAKLARAQGDPAMMRQVFTNLVANAFKFTRHKPRAKIEIRSEVKDEETVYWVTDNGAGFDAQYSDKLFGVFQRLHPMEEFEGTGVGLAMVQRIIHRHGGRVWADGKVNAGATFYFTLPRHETNGHG
jgi:signal transduction histidine kinase